MNYSQDSLGFHLDLGNIKDEENRKAAKGGNLLLYKTSYIRDPKDYEDWMGRHSSLSLTEKALF